MARQFDHILCQIDGFSNPPRQHQVPNQPLVVVSVVVDLVRHDLIAHHVGMVDARGRFLLPRGVRITMESRVRVAWHVPHVSNTGSAWPAFRGGVQSELVLFVVPEMDAKVMGRVFWIGVKNIGQD